MKRNLLHTFAVLLLLPPALLSAGPVPDYFQMTLPPLLPVREDAGVQGTITASAVSTGDKGWAVFLTQGAGNAVLGYSVRMLPPAFDTLPPGVVNWTGEAQPARFILQDGQDSPARIQFQGGAGGAWFLRHGNGQISGQWCSQAAGGPDGPMLDLAVGNGSIYNFTAVGDGRHVWVLWGTDSGVIRGLVLSAEVEDHRLLASFTTPGSSTAPGSVALSSLTARPGQLLIVRHSPADSWPITTVDTAGNTASRSLTNPGGTWMGALPTPDGYAGVYAVKTDPSPATLENSLFIRPMNADGTWKDGSAAIAVPGTLHYFGELLPGPVGGVVRAGSETYFLKADGTLSALPEMIHAGAPGMSASGTLLLPCSGLALDRITVSRVTPPTPGIEFTSQITSGRGTQSEPSLGWGPRGLYLTNAVKGYGSSGTAIIRGVNGRPDSTEPPQLLTMNRFSSPSQAWNGEYQLIAWRNETIDATGVGDDLAAMIYRGTESSPLQLVVPQFTLADGPGSQRGVSVSPYGLDRFLVAWREEPAGDPGPLVYSIRAAFVSLDGTVTPPGGRVIESASYELSSVNTSLNGGLVWRAFVNGSSGEVIRGTQLQPDGTPGEIRQISPTGHNAASPALLNGWGSITVWRNRFDDRIYASVDQGPATAISSVHRRARQPVPISLSNETSAVLWLEEDYKFSPMNSVLLATLRHGVWSEPVTVTRGYFDRDTLTAASDGYDRIALALQDNSAGSEGLRVMMIAPLVSANAGLTIRPNQSGSSILNWEVSQVFAHAADVVQYSSDLRTWSPAAGQLTVTQDGLAEFLTNAPPGRGFYRLIVNTTGPRRPTP